MRRHQLLESFEPQLGKGVVFDVSGDGRIGLPVVFNLFEI